jgi:hypothetical protein
MDDKGSNLNVDGPSVLKIELHVPRRELESKNQGKFSEQALKLLTKLALLL